VGFEKSAGTHQLYLTPRPTTMSDVIKDIYFLNIEDAFAEAAKQRRIVDANGRERLQYCYYDGPLTDIVLENFIQVSQDAFVEFFSHNRLPLPQLLGLPHQEQVIFNDMPADVLEEIQQQRAGYKVAEYIHFDSYFVDPLKALNVAKQHNRIACGHPTIDGLQICYYRGELPEHSLANLVHLELDDFVAFFIRSRLRIPENLDLPEELEEEIKAAVREDINQLIAEVKRKRNALVQQLLAKAKAMQPAMLSGPKPRLFVPSSRLTTVMQYSSQGMANAFAALGWEVLFYIESNDMEGSNMIDMLEQYISFAPHACFYVNSLNNSFMHDDVVNMVWWQDLMPQLKQRQPLNWRSTDFNFSISPLFDDYLRDCQAASIERLHFVIDERVFNSCNAAARDDKIVFIGSSYLPVFNVNDQQQRQAVEQLIAVMQQGGRFDQQTVAAIAAASSLSYEFVFWKLLHYVIRDHGVKWLCGQSLVPVEVYGRYWDQDSDVALHFRGELAHGEEVANVYRSARYALVCHPFEINSQRLAEVAACGCIPVVYDCRDVAEAPYWQDYCLFFKTAAELKQILQQRLQPKLPPEGLAEGFTYRAAAKKVIEYCNLSRLPGILPEQSGEIAAVLPEYYSNRLRLQSSQAAVVKQCLENLRKNLECLQQHRQALHDYLFAAWRDSDYLFTLEQNIAGELWQVAINENAQNRFQLDNIAGLEHQMIIRENAAKMQRENTCCYALVGMGAGYELLEIFNATANPIPEMAEFEVAIYLLEADPGFWLLNLLLHDLEPLLTASRLLVYHDADYPQQLLAELEKFAAPLPDMLFALDPQRSAEAGQLFNLVEQVRTSRAERHQRNLQQIAAYYNSINHEQWRQKFSPDNVGQLRVMGFISRFSSFLKYCMRDWLDGFDRLGVTTLTCSESENYYLSNIEHLIDEINCFKPDLILSIDHFRHEYEGIPESVPFANWIQDMLPNITDNQIAMKKMDFTYGFSRHWLAMNNWDLYSNFPIEYLPLGFNDKHYYPEPFVGYEYDLLVISHLNEPEQTFLAFRDVAEENWLFDSHEIALLNEGSLSLAELRSIYRVLMKYLNELSINQYHKLRVDGQDNGFADIDELLQHQQIHVDKTVLFKLLAGSRSRFHYDYLLVMKTAPITTLIDAGLDLRIALYGRNWEKFSKFAPYAKGIAENGKFMNTLMNRAKICFNGSPGASLHMHALEIMASSAFMISRSTYKDAAPLDEYFSNDEVIYYIDETDLVEKIKYYLTNDELRNQVAQRANQRIKALFSYQAIAGQILNSISCRVYSANLSVPNE
jgi:glycosyltransferase involved in cell wall biosynthesis